MKLKRRIFVLVILLLVSCGIGCGTEKKQEKEEEKLSCEFYHTESVSQIMSNFTRYLQVYATVTGGTGEYTYIFEVTKEGDYFPSFESGETDLSGVSFSVKENVALDVKVWVMDSAGLFDSFEYHIDRYE